MTIFPMISTVAFTCEIKITYYELEGSFINEGKN